MGEQFPGDKQKGAEIFRLDPKKRKGIPVGAEDASLLAQPAPSRPRIELVPQSPLAVPPVETVRDITTARERLFADAEKLADRILLATEHVQSFDLSATENSYINRFTLEELARVLMIAEIDGKKYTDVSDLLLRTYLRNSVSEARDWRSKAAAYKKKKGNSDITK